MGIPHFICLFISLISGFSTFWLLKITNNEYSSTDFCVNTCLHFIWEYTQRGELLDHMVIPGLLFEELPNSFPMRLHCFIISPAMYEDSNASTSLPMLVIVCLFLFYASGWEVMSPCLIVGFIYINLMRHSFLILMMLTYLFFSLTMCVFGAIFKKP